MWVEAGAHAVRKRSECGGVVLQGGVGRRGCRVALVCVLSLKLFRLSGAVSFLCVVPPIPAGDCMQSTADI